MEYRDIIFERTTNGSNIRIRIDPKTGNKILTIDSKIDNESILFRIPDNPSNLTKLGEFTKSWGSLILALVAFILKYIPNVSYNMYLDFILSVLIVLGLMVFLISLLLRIGIK